MELLVQQVGNKVFDRHKHAFRHKDIIQKLKAKGERYFDEEFPNKFESLVKTKNAPPQWKSFVFKRSKEFLRGEVKVFDNIDPGDIRQGGLGDCYFLCCLSVLAERPKLVERLFITEDYNDAGCYALWLNDDGKWKSFVVDDYFPCTRDGGAAFTRSVGSELWVLLLEKCYAKMYGSYDIIEGGHPALALRDLTGAPYDCLESSDPDEVWKYIKESDEAKYLLTCYTKSTDIREEKNPLGIVSGHAYSILDAKEVQTADGNERIVQVRNPWGKFEWKGDWSDNSSKWTKDVIEQVPNFTRADDGAFWICIQDFTKFFEGVGICKLHEDYYYRSLGFKHTTKTFQNNKNIQDDSNIPYQSSDASVIRLKINKKSHIFLSVNQTDDRKFMTKQGEPYCFSIVRVLLAKVEHYGLKYIDGIFYNDRNVVLENNLNPGHYIITVEVMWEQSFHREFNISAYSQYPVEFEQLNKADVNHIQRNIIKSMVLADEDKKVKDYTGIKEPNIKKYTGSKFGIAYFYYQNQSTNMKTLNEVVTLSQRQNLRICTPFTNNNQFEVNVLPQNDALVMFKCLDGSEYVFATKSSFKAVVIPHDEMVRYARSAYTETTYLDDADDVVNLSNDTDYYDQFIRDDRDNLEVFNYQEVAADMNAGFNFNFGGVDAGVNVQAQDQEQNAGSYTNTGQTKDSKPQAAEYNYLASSQKFLDPFIKKAEDGPLLAPNIDDDILRGRNLFSVQVLANIPKYVRDNSDFSSFPIQQIEKNICDYLSQSIRGRENIIETFTAIIVGLFITLPLLLAFLKAQFLDIAVGILLIALLFAKQSTYKTLPNVNLVLRAIPYTVLFSILLDFIWIMIYHNNWISHDIVDPQMLLHDVKEFIVVLIYIHMGIKTLFAILFGRKVVEALSEPIAGILLY